MIITIKPDDIIKRCLWSDYKKFVLKGKTEEEIMEIVEKNEPTVISEDDAYVIGLLKILETDNLVHRFNQHILETLQIKSNVFDDGLYINKNSLIREVVSFKNRFPSYYNPPLNYKKSIEDMVVYVDRIKEKIDLLEVFPYTNKDKTYDFYNSNQVKKLLEL